MRKISWIDLLQFGQNDLGKNKFIFSDEWGDSLYITKEVKLPIDRNNNERRINSIVLNEFRSLKWLKL